MKKRVNFLLLCTSVAVAGCTFSSANRYPQGVTKNANFKNESSCVPTKIQPIISGEGTNEWKQRVQASADAVTQVLQTQEFSAACQSLELTRTNGRSVQEVCREMVCSGEISPSISFYHDPNTRAIAYESDGALFINTAKEAAGAGGTGNIAHEVTHTLNYTHFSNWAFLGKCSVPYRIGNLVEKLANDQSY